MNIKSFVPNLYEKDGIYFPTHINKHQISYPDSGNDYFYKIEENSFWFRHRNNCIVECVKKFSPENIFFDIGGGNGFVSKGLDEAGVTTVIVEPELQGCLNAQKRGLKNIICSSFENISFNLGSVPSIGLFDVVEHIENDVEFLSSIHSLLKVNGLVFITVPAYNALWSNEDIDLGHFRRYKIKQLEYKLNKVGFKTEYSTYMFSILPIPVFLFRSLPSKLGFNKNSDSFDKHYNEHKTKKGIIDKVLNSVWSWELNKIRKGKRINVGGSCFIVARKI